VLNILSILRAGMQLLVQIKLRNQLGRQDACATENQKFQALSCTSLYL
jgi:hypothetical protein